MNRLLLLGGIGALLYLTGRKALLVSSFANNLKFSITGATSATYQYPQIYFDVHVQIDNPTDFSISLDKILTDVFIDYGKGYQILASSIPTSKSVSIKPNNYSRFTITQAINLLNAGQIGLDILRSGLLNLSAMKLKVEPKALIAGQWMAAKPYELPLL